MSYFKSDRRFFSKAFCAWGALLALVVMAGGSAGCNLFHELEGLESGAQDSSDIAVDRDGVDRDEVDRDGVDRDADSDGDEDMLNVADYGAIANADYFDEGSQAYYSDPEFEAPAFNATNAIQSAIDYAAAVGKTEVYIPPGNYLIQTVGFRDSDDYEYSTRGGIQMLSGITLTMSSETTLVMNPTDKPGYAFISIDHKEDVVVRGGKIRGDRPENSSSDPKHAYGISIANGSKRVRVEDVEIMDCENSAIAIIEHTRRSARSTRTESIVIQDVDLHHSGDIGIVIADGKDITVRDSAIHHQTTYDDRIGILVVFRNSDAADLRILNNSFAENAYASILIANTVGRGNSISNIEIQGNSIQDGQIGIDVLAEVDGLNISDNNISVTCLEDIPSAGIATNAPHSKDVVIASNTIISETTEWNYTVGLYTGSREGAILQKNLLKGQEIGIIVNGNDARVIQNEIRDFLRDSIVVQAGEHSIEDNLIIP